MAESAAIEQNEINLQKDHLEDSRQSRVVATAAAPQQDDIIAEPFMLRIHPCFITISKSSICYNVVVGAMDDTTTVTPSFPYRCAVHPSLDSQSSVVGFFPTSVSLLQSKMHYRRRTNEITTGPSDHSGNCKTEPDKTGLAQRKI